METNLSGLDLGVSKLIGGYWSSSTDTVISNFAWEVSAASSDLKEMSLPGGVRAIRAF